MAIVVPSRSSAAPAHLAGATFMAQLRTKAIASRTDCVIAAALVAKPLKWTRRYDKCRRLLDRVPGLVLGDSKDAGEVLSRGYAAHVFLKVLRIKGGVLLRMKPSSHKFAYRELTALEMIAPGGAQNAMSGEELVGLVEASGHYQKERTHR